MTTSRTEADAVAEIAQDVHRVHQLVTPDSDEVQSSILTGDERVHYASLETFRYEPRRPRGATTVTDADSFTTLLGRDDHHGSVIFADESQARLTAVLNYASWRDHTVRLQLRYSEQWNAWMRLNGSLMRQNEFAELIEDRAADIIDPSGADMLELAQSFHATKSGAFESTRRLSNGTVQVTYREDINAKAGVAGQLEVPEQFVLSIPVWQGGEPVRVIARLRYRIEVDRLVLGYKIAGQDELVRQAFTATVAAVTAGLESEWQHTVVYGIAPDPITPLP